MIHISISSKNFMVLQLDASILIFPYNKRLNGKKERERIDDIKSIKEIYINCEFQFFKKFIKKVKNYN